MELPPGTYRLGFSFPGYKFDEVRVTVRPEGFTAHFLEFKIDDIKSGNIDDTGSTGKVQTGVVNVQSSPTRATVELDGRRMGDPTDMYMINVPIGRHSIAVYFQKSEAQTIEFELGAGATATILADFFKKAITIDATYKITVESVPAGAAIAVDGLAMGATPATITLPHGRHEIMITKDGYTAFRKVADIAGTEKIVATLVSISGRPTAPTIPTTEPVPRINEPVIPAKYLASYAPSSANLAGRDAFESAEHSRAKASEEEVARLLASNRISGDAPLAVAEYLRRIDALDSGARRIGEGYATAKTSGLERATVLFDAELAGIRKANPIDPWENDKEYAVRIALEVCPVEKAKAADLARYSALVEREKSERVGALSKLSEETAKSFRSAFYIEEGPAISATVGEFDRDKKNWPVKVESTAPDFAYSASFEYSIAAEKDMGGAYRAFVAALGSGTVAARLEYGYERIVGDPYMVVAVRQAALYDKATGKVYARGGIRRPVFGVAAAEPGKRLSMPRVRFESLLSGTMVSVDGQALGSCPLETTLAPGTRTATFAWDGVPESGEEKKLSLNWGQSATVKAGTELGLIKLSGLPAGATVSVDGTKVEGQPGIMLLRVGPHTVAVNASGYEPWSLEQAIIPAKLYEISVKLEKTSLVRMVSVEGGSVTMGSSSGDSDERPEHRVTVSSFLIGTYEVTQGQYKQVTGANPSRFSSGGDAERRPVEQVSWYDSVAFCNKLSDLEGYARIYTINGNTVTADFSKNGYRLPTEAEWEYAARGGKQSKGYTYSGSNDIGQVAWYDGNSGSTTHVAGTKAANELGLYDMSGNVWEWCNDWYGNYGSGAQSDPMGASSGGNRVYRGGSWNGDAGYCRSANRDGNDPGGRDSRLGFRVARRP